MRKDRIIATLQRPEGPPLWRNARPVIISTVTAPLTPREGNDALPAPVHGGLSGGSSSGGYGIHVLNSITGFSATTANLTLFLMFAPHLPRALNGHSNLRVSSPLPVPQCGILTFLD